jgi:hypothetical protein
VWALWIVGGLAVWVVVALLFAVVVGRGIRLADERSPGTGVVPAPVPAAARTRRRAIPLPPIGIGLAALAVLLEGTGFLLRLNGATGAAARVLSMDAPQSLPRMYVTALFGAAALVAVAGAGAVPGRRTWWTAVGLVAAGIAAVKAGATVHARALDWLTDTAGPAAALIVCAALAAGVVLALWFLSRTERRDRRRVLSSLAGYAVAAVGLSAVSSMVAAATGGFSSWAAGATFVEEAGEALAGVAFLIAVLAGVAPRMVLPAGWPLRREADAHTLDAAEAQPRWTVTGNTAG